MAARMRFWALVGLILFLACSTAGVAVFSIREARRIEQLDESGVKVETKGGFNPTLAVWQLAAGSFAVVGVGAWLRIAADALTRNKSPKWAGLILLVLPGFYYIYQNFRHTWRLAATALTLALMSGFCAYQAQSIINSTA